VSARPRVVGLFAPLCRPRANIHRLFAPQGHSKNRPIFGTSQNRPRWWQSRPLAALWPPMAPFCILFGSILGAIFHHFSILFRTPQNLDFAIPYSVFEGFSNLKALILGPLFDHFFDPILGPPLEEPFGPPWSPKVPTLPPHVDFGPFLGPPLDPKWDLGATRGGQEKLKREVLRAGLDVPKPFWK
jgi:hypothetical protein